MRLILEILRFLSFIWSIYPYPSPFIDWLQKIYFQQDTIYHHLQKHIWKSTLQMIVSVHVFENYILQMAIPVPKYQWVKYRTQ